MSFNLNETQLRTDIMKMEEIIKNFRGEYPDLPTRKKISNSINKYCKFRVTDRSNSEDIDSGIFRYSIEPNHIKEEVILKFIN